MDKWIKKMYKYTIECYSILEKGNSPTGDNRISPFSGKPLLCF